MGIICQTEERGFVGAIVSCSLFIIIFLMIIIMIIITIIIQKV